VGELSDDAFVRDLPPIDATIGVGRRWAGVGRPASCAEAATLTSCQLSVVDPGRLSINFNSFSRSFAASVAPSGPNNSIIAPMNAANSHSATVIVSAQDGFRLIVFSSTEYVAFHAWLFTILEAEQTLDCLSTTNGQHGIAIDVENLACYLARICQA
jgi:hypothetical protein